MRGATGVRTGRIRPVAAGESHYELEGGGEEGYEDDWGRGSAVVVVAMCVCVRACVCVWRACVHVCLRVCVCDKYI